VLTIAMLVYALTPEIAEMTRRNVDALLANTMGDFELRVLFNGGPPVALPADERLVPIYMAERSSIAKAYNLAFSEARGDVFACVHNDVAAPRGWDVVMRDAMVDGFAFPMVLEDARECAERGIGTTQAGFPPGCCFMFPRALYAALGGFDEAFEGCHFEDNDLWLRGMLAGYPMTRANVEVEHGRGKTRTSLPDLANPDFVRNKQVYINKHRQPDGSVPIPTLEERPWQRLHESDISFAGSTGPSVTATSTL